MSIRKQKGVARQCDVHARRADPGEELGRVGPGAGLRNEAKLRETAPGLAKKLAYKPLSSLCATKGLMREVEQIKAA